PDDVVKEYQAINARRELAHFKGQCCLLGLPLAGKWVTPGEVIKDFPESPEGKLGMAYFKQQCFLLGLPLHGKKITADSVVKDYQAVNAILELARFKEQCCLMGLPLHGRQVSPDEVVADFPDSPEGKLGIARFKEHCCLKGVPLHGRQVIPEVVVKDFQAIGAKLELARFKQVCCLWGVAVNGQEVMPGDVVRDFPNSPEGRLGIARFKAECCLRGLLLNDQQVTPESVIKDFEHGGWLLERAIFYSQLALNARVLDSAYLDNQKVLEAFNKAPGDHSSREVEFLMQRLKQPRRYDEDSEAQDVMQKAWQIINNVSIRGDQQHRQQCILKFMAMHHELSINHQGVSAEQVLQSIKTLRPSFQSSRLRFFFMAHCHITRLRIDGREITEKQVMADLQHFPAGSNLRHALGCWFEQFSSEANIMHGVLFDWKNTIALRQDRDSYEYANSASQHAASLAISRAYPVSPGQCTDNACLSIDGDRQSANGVNALTLKTLEIIQEINGCYSRPPILITGSYARFLQNLCSHFNDIDIICTTEKSARTLLQKLRALNEQRESEIPQSIIIWPIPGCQAIKLPYAYSIQLKNGDLGRNAIGFHINVDPRVNHENEVGLALHVPGVERPVRCLSFAEETGLLNDTLGYLVDNLEPLTEKLQKGAKIDLPRTILFNNPQNTGERIYGLLMRSLLTLNKARQFIALYSEAKAGKTGKPDCWTDQLKEEQQRLHTLTEKLQMKLTGHVCRNDFERRVNGWLSTARGVNDYQVKKKTFIRTLLAIIHPE
ncbi:hypothetical protein, partial [Endozoicomonas sp. SESOKO1]|uniref:hypothetical protein n=1 Tax=Endozoicomonas sp. SESOKO1 TaxID=2828742 RepID=UPI0021493E1C